MPEYSYRVHLVDVYGPTPVPVHVSAPDEHVAAQRAMDNVREDVVGGRVVCVERTP